MKFETDGVLAFSRAVAKEFGVSAALLYNHLLYEHNYWKQKGKLDDEGYFWEDQADIAEWILVHKNHIGRIADTLSEAGLIQKKVSYKPGTTIRTTKWKIVISEVSKMRISEDSKMRTSILKEKTNKIELSSEITKSELAEDNHKSEDGSSFADGDDGEAAAAEVRMKPEAIYQKLRLLWPGSGNSLRKQKLETIRKLQDMMDDRDIIAGVGWIAKHPEYTFSDGRTFTETLTHLLTDKDINKTAKKIAEKAEIVFNKVETKDKPKINFNTSYCY